ncbi:hypothetical protein D3C76_730860 [compost metagenome]
MLAADHRGATIGGRGEGVRVRHLNASNHAGRPAGREPPCPLRNGDHKVTRLNGTARELLLHCNCGSQREPGIAGVGRPNLGCAMPPLGGCLAGQVFAGAINRVAGGTAKGSDRRVPDQDIAGQHLIFAPADAQQQFRPLLGGITEVSMNRRQQVREPFRRTCQFWDHIIQCGQVTLHRRQVQLLRAPVLHVGRGRLNRVERVAQAKQLGQRARLEDGLERAALWLDVDCHLVIRPNLGFTPGGRLNEVAVHQDADRR